MGDVDVVIPLLEQPIASGNRVAKCFAGEWRLAVPLDVTANRLEEFAVQMAHEKLRSPNPLFRRDLCDGLIEGRNRVARAAGLKHQLQTLHRMCRS